MTSENEILQLGMVLLYDFHYFNFELQIQAMTWIETCTPSALLISGFTLFSQDNHFNF